ncbi:hypothetical protein EV667_1416 [Ancylobacter aquaticus]|uniref:Alpha-L-arabinofuranosidase B catalytic domain-containing protein n=1 Tax=Ancylobacter aquaticus TaxID=100 RepID=A0A4R1I7E2_ANCAQ|nr:arabinofuranosidase catalytic domain-containing protein [Ancylobacter aquaticus]TCK31307.1 hypothetical protein EV667_1416 [Ancylobacter aquaticus]
MASIGFTLDLRHRRRAPAVALPLDGFAGSLYAAFGMRRLLSAHAGPCVRARRTSDGAEVDVGFTAPGDFDVAALLAFAGAGSVYATRWYDQTGNGRHAEQATGAAQPRLVSAGVLDIGPNGRPGMVFSGAQYVDMQNSLGIARGASALTVAAATGAPPTSATQAIFSTSIGGGPQSRAILYCASGTLAVGARSIDGGAEQSVVRPIGVSTRLIARIGYAAGGLDISGNGETTTGVMSPAQSAPDTNSSSASRIGANAVGTSGFAGAMSMLALSRSALDVAALDAALTRVMP